MPKRPEYDELVAEIDALKREVADLHGRIEGGERAAREVRENDRRDIETLLAHYRQSYRDRDTINPTWQMRPVVDEEVERPWEDTGVEIAGGAGIKVTGQATPRVSVDLATESGLAFTEGGDAGKLMAKVNAATGLAIDADGIKTAVNADHLEHADNAIKHKLKTSGVEVVTIYEDLDTGWLLCDVKRNGQWEGPTEGVLLYYDKAGQLDDAVLS